MQKNFSYIIISFSLIIFIITSCSPDPSAILTASYLKCQSIQSGYYEMENHWKMMSRNDTMRIIQQSYFKKIENDSVVPFLFNSRLHSRDVDKNGEMTEINLLYTGNELVIYSGRYGHVMPRKNNDNNIWMLYNKNISFNSYLPITHHNSKPVPSPLTLASGKFTARYVNREYINGRECYHLKAVVPEEFDISVLRGYGLITRTEYHYWISKKDSVPVQITVSRNLKINDDTLSEFQKIILTEYELNHLPDNALFTLQSVPSQVHLEPVVNNTKTEPLKTGEPAPDWRLPAIGKDTLSLSDFKGSLVLLDFFITSCPPCVEILPSLENLSRKYQHKGLKIIGLDGLDSPKALEYFRTSHGISYPLLISNPYINRAYNVSGYPTTYLIGKDGKILFSHTGAYDRNILEKMERIILQHIDR